MKGTKERANEGPSYLLNGSGPVQKRDEERASPKNGRGVPEQPDEGPWISALMLAGGGAPQEACAAGHGDARPGQKQGVATCLAVPAVKSLTSDTRLSPPPAGPKSRSRRLS